MKCKKIEQMKSLSFISLQKDWRTYVTVYNCYVFLN